MIDLGLIVSGIQFDNKAALELLWRVRVMSMYTTSQGSSVSVCRFFHIARHQPCFLLVYCHVAVVKLQCVVCLSKRGRLAV